MCELDAQVFKDGHDHLCIRMRYQFLQHFLLEIYAHRSSAGFGFQEEPSGLHPRQGDRRRSAECRIFYIVDLSVFISNYLVIFADNHLEALHSTSSSHSVATKVAECHLDHRCPRMIPADLSDDT